MAVACLPVSSKREMPMKLSALAAQLNLLQEQYGDLECVVYADAGIESVTRAKIHVLQDFDFGSIGSHKTGDRVVMIWSRI
jgi:hypothetical protein